MRHILFFLPVAMLLAACTQDELTAGGEALPYGEYPLQLTTAIGEAAVTPDTRSTVDDTWNGDETVYVQMASSLDVGEKSTMQDVEKIGWENLTVYKYTADSNGSLTLQEGEPYYWRNTSEKLYIRAWYTSKTEDIPVLNGSWSASTDQSDKDKLNAEDLLYTCMIQSFTRGPVPLTLRHMMARVVINIKSSDYLTQNGSNLSVRMNSMDYSGEFQWSNNNAMKLESNNDNDTESVSPCKCQTANPECFATYEALLIPQGVTGKHRRLEVRVDNVTYIWEISFLDNNEFIGGCKYILNITVDAKGLGVQIDTNIDWNSDGASGSGSVTLP